MTITLYFTVTPAGTLLCQGRDCPAWDSQEYDVSADDVGFHVLGCRADILGTNCSKLLKLKISEGGGGGGGELIEYSEKEQQQQRQENHTRTQNTR